MTQNNHNARSLVEQLSGIRLIAFLAIAAINLAVLSAFCILPINLEKLALANLLFFVTAIASLATLTISSLTASAPTKMALIAILVALCLWMVRWVSLPSELKLSSFYASVFVSQALLIFVAATIYQERVATVPTSIRFGVKDMLFVVATVAILIPTLQYVFSEWPIEFLFPAEDFFLILIATLSNTLWTFAIMFLYLKQESRSRKIQVVAGMTIAAVLVEALGYALCGKPINAIQVITFRAIFVIWIAISMLPIIGFERLGDGSDRGPATG